MPWISSQPPKENRHTLKARKLDAKAERARRQARRDKADRLEDRAHKRAAKGGWF